jgi:Holliday junction resolvase
VRRAARLDSTHAAIVNTLKACGWSVVSTARMGKGFPDLVIQRRGQTYLVEVKAGKGKLTKDQEQFHEAFDVVILRTIEDAAGLR